MPQPIILVCFIILIALLTVLYPSLSSVPRRDQKQFAMFTCMCCQSWYLDATGIKSVFVEGKIMIADITLSVLTY